MTIRKKIARKVKTNPKKFFTYIRTKKKTKSNIGPLKDERGALTQDNETMIEILNKNFASVFTVENIESIPENTIAPRGLEPMDIGSIDERDVRKYLDKLETNKFTGPDDLSPRLLKELKQQILKPPTAIYNLTLQLKQVP